MKNTHINLADSNKLGGRANTLGDVIQINFNALEKQSRK